MRLSTGQKIGAGFAAALLILVVGVLSFWSARRALDAAGWVTHTHEVLVRLDNLLTDMVDVETAGRGYVITGDPGYLAPYQRGRVAMDTNFRATRALTRDQPDQQRRLAELAPLLERRIAVADAVIAARRTAGFEPAAELVRGNRGRALMDSIRTAVRMLEAEEQRLLTMRVADEARAERSLALTTLLGALGAFALVALMIRVIQLDTRYRHRLAAERDQLLAREQAARAQLAAIQRITDAALSPLALDELLEELLTRLREIIGADTACVHLLMRDGVQLELCRCVGVTSEIIDRVRVPLGAGVLGAIAARKEPVAVADMARADLYDPVLSAHYASLLGVPLSLPAGDSAPGETGMTADRVIGVLHVGTVRPRSFSAAEVELMVLVAERAASAIERARLYESERRSEERSRLLVENMVDYAICLIDPEGRVTSWNAGGERLYGYPTAEILHQDVALLFPPDSMELDTPAMLLAAALERGRVDGEGLRVRRDGSRFWAEASVTVVWDEGDDRHIGFAMITRDLTERKHANEALLAAKEAAEVANRAKSQFLATMSHEIRTPINAIVGYAELLEMGLDGPLSEPQLERLGRVRASASHLLALVNEVLDLSKIEAHQLHVRRIRGSAGDAATAAIGLVLPQAGGRGVTVTSACSPERDVPYFGDPGRVGQVLVNLLSNAVKFTDRGGTVTVQCFVTGTPSPRALLPDGDCWCALQVSDTGVGIAPEQLEAVFEPFVQAEGSGSSVGIRPVYTRSHGGTGLGLTISRRLARLMGGDVTVESEVSAGSTFTLWLPAPPDVLEELEDDDRQSADSCATPERRARVRRPHGLSAAGTVLRVTMDELLRTHIARLRGELGAPGVSQMSDAELENHLGTLLAEVGRTLVLIEQASGDASSDLRDGTELQRLIAERHGAQRGALGWSEALHRREITILRQDVESMLRRRLSGEPIDLEGALAVLHRLLENAERAGVRGLISSVPGE